MSSGAAMCQEAPSAVPVPPETWTSARGRSDFFCAAAPPRIKAAEARKQREVFMWFSSVEREEPPQSSEGVSHLGGGRVDFAVVALVSAAELRPERADCHLYLAVALQRNGAATAARAAWAKAHELCPDIMETKQGKRALALGLDQAALD